MLAVSSVSKVEMGSDASLGARLMAVLGEKVRDRRFLLLIVRNLLPAPFGLNISIQSYTYDIHILVLIKKSTALSHNIITAYIFIFNPIGPYTMGHSGRHLGVVGFSCGTRRPYVRRAHCSCCFSGWPVIPHLCSKPLLSKFPAVNTLLFVQRPHLSLVIKRNFIIFSTLSKLLASRVSKKRLVAAARHWLSPSRRIHFTVSTVILLTATLLTVTLVTVTFLSITTLTVTLLTVTPWTVTRLTVTILTVTLLTVTLLAVTRLTVTLLTVTILTVTLLTVTHFDCTFGGYNFDGYTTGGCPGQTVTLPIATMLMLTDMPYW